MFDMHDLGQLRTTTERPRAAAAWFDALMSSPGRMRNCAKDEVIFCEGEPTRHFYRVTSGAVRSCKLLADGRRHIAEFHMTDDVFGLERGPAHRLSAEATKSTTVVAFPLGDVDSIMARDSDKARQFASSTLLDLERARSHMILLGRKSAPERIASFLLDLADRSSSDAYELPMSRTDIADYLGLTVETVSRILTHLARQSVIDLPAAGRNVVLRKKAALRRMDEGFATMTS